MTGGLEASRVTVTAGGRLIVDGVDCTMPTGAVTALIGPNGAGKTTLLHALAALPRPEQGAVRFEHQDLGAMSRRERARILAFVEQDIATDTAMSVTDVVALGRMPHQSIFGDEPADGARIVADALATVEMTAFAAREFASLSGGERQRIMLARALAQQPRLLLLDEPTNHLDIHAQLTVLGLLGRLAADGVTVVAALHDLSLAATYADHVVVLQDGRVVAAGPTAQTLRPSLIRAVYRVEATVLENPITKRPVIALSPLD
ncbi:ATP-binding cassette domain-containing protein [Leifsonia sp. H3M29-4]|uniref:ABC transporter ATP-binding protein n=1 Tax=Salinibacterium metalliresistens TaxID=3031321 RepID=UPI0023DA745C|nr:ATP-binding cassette domain-containing protein [Salinibacterium metalliresistens]MDF1479609.1 ATP-binding cassette domain-containing protein [Salinibacterium metalliresistens]